MRIKKLIVFLRKPSGTLSVGFLVVVGVLAGLLLKTGFDTSLAVTSSDAFCTSCHEMASYPQAEMQDTIHVSNRTGTIAQCADCHVPHDSLGKVVRKVEGIRELYGKVTSKINTPEKYEAHRLVMAEKVWEDMRANDSANCRACHINFEQSLGEQYEWAARQHGLAIDQGKTCIDCHQGIAHALPNTRLMSKPLAQ